MSNEFDDVEDNDAVAAAKAARASRRKASETEKKSTSWKTVAGIGIGSAAVLAALIYANKARKRNDDDEG
jgi:hypothetical protein